jgi:hypothetical protein
LSRPAAGRVVTITPRHCQKCHLSGAAGSDQFCRDRPLPWAYVQMLRVTAARELFEHGAPDGR